MTHSNHSDEVPIRKFRESDLCQLVRLISETIGISYAGVYPPRAVQFFKDFQEEVGVTPTTFSFLGIIADPNTAADDLVHRHSQKIQPVASMRGASGGIARDPRRALCTI